MKSAAEQKIWFSAQDLAERWGLTAGAIENWRAIKNHPLKFKKLGKGVNAPVRYHVDEVKKFEAVKK